MSILDKVKGNQKSFEEYLDSSNGLQEIDILFIAVVILGIMYFKKRFSKK